VCQKVIEALGGSIEVLKSNDSVDSYEVQFFARKSRQIGTDVSYLYFKVLEIKSKLSLVLVEE
jgi:hypothetical protein